MNSHKEMSDDEMDAVLDALNNNNPEERDQAKALHEQARAHGMRFEAYLPPALAHWLLAHIERGRFADPSDGAYLAFASLRNLESHKDLHFEAMRRGLNGSAADQEADAADHEIFAGLDSRFAESCPEAALWKPIER